MPGVTAENPPNAFCRTLDDSVFLERFGEIVATARLVSAVRADPGADQKLICADQEDQQAPNKQARQPQDASHGTHFLWHIKGGPSVSRQNPALNPGSSKVKQSLAPCEGIEFLPLVSVLARPC